MAANKLAYTEIQSAELIEAYTANPTQDTVEKFALAYGKTVKSIVAKLSRSGGGIYKKKEYTTKAGTKPGENKEALADAIGRVLGMTGENDISSLTKCTKNALHVIFKALAESKPIDGKE